MARPTATPASRRHRYNTKGRTPQDWDVLNEVWTASATVRACCNDSFTQFEFHAFAEPRTQQSAEGRQRTKTIWNEVERLGFAVTRRRPVHFSKPIDLPLFEAVVDVAKSVPSKMQGLWKRVGSA